MTTYIFMKKLMLPLIMVLFVPFAYSQLYADVAFDVSENGEIEITGDTNYKLFSGVTNELTSKNGSLWTLNIQSPRMDTFEYVIILPDGATIKHIKANSDVSIEDVSGTLAIGGVGNNKPIDIVVQYTTNGKKTSITMSAVIIALLIIAIVFLVVKNGILKKPNKKEEKVQKTEEPKKQLDRKRFTDRQLEIIDYLQKNGTVTQAELEKELDLPKSSLSRNIDTLVQKGTIFKEAKGMSNVIGLKD